jgi:Fungal specific transcription factor domain
MDARQQLERSRIKESKIDPSANFSADGADHLLSEMPSVGRSPRRMLKARTPQDLAYARAQLSDFGRGLLKPPVTGAQSMLDRQNPRDLELPPLPARSDADQYLSFYFECIHRQFPVLHWQTFHHQYGEAFDGAATHTMPPEWIAVLFVVLACGALSTRDPSRMPQAQDFLTRAVSTINFWEDDVSINQAVVAFLASIFLAEVNRKSASWIWLGSALRIAQDLGLHVQGGQWLPIEGQMRKRIWYSFYVWDR